MANLGIAVSRLVAENAIESDKTNRLMQRSGAAASEAEIDEKNKEKEIANDVKSAASYVEMASSTVNAARSAVKVGEAANDAAQYNSTQPGLTSGTEHARSGDAATRDQGMAEVMNTRLGEGQTVGERFGENRARILMTGQVGQGDARQSLSAQPGETRDQWNTRVGGQLREAGFTSAEVDGLWDKSKDGNFSTSDAVDFMWANRKQPEQAKAEVTRDKIIDAIQGQSVAFLTRNLGEMGKQAQTQAKRSGDTAGQLNEISEKALDLNIDHNKKLGDLEIEGLRQRRGGGGGSAKK
ncbi:MAG: hypothetical protein U1E65_29300 [Myxococcota bacterium]